ncbi:MAG: transcriptional regulator, AsnC family [Variovorax sp.]|nr:transcriptional regulator, AsnC family [Variovorax sp.]
MTELAEQIGLSTSPCTERVKRMERDGVITGYHARLSPVALGKTLLVFVEIKLASKSDEVFEKVRKELLHVPDVQECHLVSGGFDYLVKARLGGMSEYRRLLGDVLKKLPVEAESHSYIVMEEIKETMALVVDR